MLINFYPPPIPQFHRRADEKPADYLRRQWIIGAWARSSWFERLVFAIVILLWWPTTILHAAYLTSRRSHDDRTPRTDRPCVRRSR